MTRYYNAVKLLPNQVCLQVANDPVYSNDANTFLHKSGQLEIIPVLQLTVTTMIILYDLATKNEHKTWSPNPWKTRYVLNYKKLSYKTIALEYPEIEIECKKHGVPPTGVKHDGTPFYTCPFIIDEETKTPVSDSYKIAEYLDKTYPSTPPVFPAGTEAFQAAFYYQFYQLMKDLPPLVHPMLPREILNPVSAEYYVRTRSAQLGLPLADFELKGEARGPGWKKVEAAFDTIDKWLIKSDGPYFAGVTLTFVDFVVGAVLKATKICFREESEDWKNIETWSDGRWKAFLDSLETYASIEN